MNKVGAETGVTVDELQTFIARLELSADELKKLDKALGEFVDTGKALDIATIQVGTTGDAVANATKAAKDSATAAVKAANEAAKEEINKWNKAHPTNKKKLTPLTVGEVTVSSKSLEAELRKQVKVQSDWESSLENLGNRAKRLLVPGADGLVNTLRGMGKEGETIINALATASDKDFKSIASSLEQLAPDAQVSLKAFMDVLTQQAADQAAWATNIAILMARGADALAQAFIDAGPKSAAAAAQAVELTDKELGKLNGKVVAAGKQALGQ
jgi:hypothetical protein